MDRALWEKRLSIVSAARRFFTDRGYLEVETPSLSLHRDVTVHIRDFSTEYIDDDGGRRTVGLITSPEHHMKRLLAAGWGDIFQICRFFRNGEVTDLHNPEFAGVEWYQVGVDYRKCMETTEELVQAAAQTAGRMKVAFRGIECDLSLPFERLPVREAVLRYAGVDIARLQDEGALREACARAGERCHPSDSWEDMFFRLFLSKVEPSLGKGRAVFLCDYPAPMAALSVLRDEGGYKVAERFELYASGVELCNGFTELRDPAEQRARFEEQIAEKKKLYGGDYTMDDEFIAALPNMPLAAGNALGLDRLIMLLLGLPRIEDTMPFPFESP
jgi:lysyl-tRNA synthetase class 2